MTDIEIYESNLLPFEIKKRYGTKAQCRCPAHDDKHASLTITKGKKCTLFYCHAGCKVDDILKAAGLEKKDTFYDVGPINQKWKAYIEGREKRRIEAIYHYVSINGGYAFTKIRLEGKKILYGVLQNERFTYGLQGRNRRELKAIYMPDGVQAINKAISEGKPIFIPEGEKDVNTLKSKGYVSLTYGGANDWQQDFTRLFKNVNVVILADNDEPGKHVAGVIQRDLQGIVKSARVVIPMSDMPKGDITDYFNAGHSKAEFEQMFKQGKNTVKESVKSVESRRISLVDKLIELDASKRFARNDKGSAELFSTVFKDVSRYNPTQKDWMYYNGIKWVADTEGMRAKRNAKKLADALLSYAVSNAGLDEKQRESYLKYASRLMNYRDRNTMVNDAKDLNYFENEELDKEDFLLNCQNCVLDLSGDKPTVLKHNADLLLSKVCNANYEPAATCELWKKTISEIMEGDTEKIKYMQKIFGLCLTGCTAEEELYFFYGGSTRNGKSTICETILSILADYGATI